MSRVHPRFREPALLLSHLENAPPGAQDLYPNASSSARLSQLRPSVNNIEHLPPATKTPGGSGRTSPDRRVAFSVEQREQQKSQAVARNVRPASTIQVPSTHDNDDDEEDDEPKLFTVLSDSNIPPDPRKDFLVFRAPSVPHSVRDSMESSIATRSVSPQQQTLPLRFSVMSPYRPVQHLPQNTSPNEPVFENMDDVDDGDARSWGEDDHQDDIYLDETHDTHSNNDEDSQDSRERSPMLAYESVAANVAADWLSPPRLETVQHAWYDNSTKSLAVPTRPSARRGDKVFPSPLIKISYDAERHAAAEALKSPIHGNKLYGTPQSEKHHHKSSLQRTPSSTSSLQRGGIPLPRSGAPEPSPPPSRTAVMDLQDDDIDSNVDVFLQDSSEALEQEVSKSLHKKKKSVVEKNEPLVLEVRRERSADRHKVGQTDPFVLEEGSDVAGDSLKPDDTPVPLVAKKKSSKRSSKDAQGKRGEGASNIPPEDSSSIAVEKSGKKTPQLGSIQPVKTSVPARHDVDDDTEHALESVISAAGPIVQSEEEVAAPIESSSRRISRHSSLRERKESQRQARQQRRDEADAILAQDQRQASEELLAYSVGSTARAHSMDPYVRVNSLRAPSPPIEQHTHVASVFQSGGSMNMLKKTQSFERAPSEQSPAPPRADLVEEVTEYQSGGNIKITSPARVRAAVQERDEAHEKKQKKAAEVAAEEDFVVFSGGSILVQIAHFPEEQEYHSHGVVHVPLKKEQEATDETEEHVAEQEPVTDDILEFQSGGNMAVVSPSRLHREPPQASQPVVVEEPPVLLSAGSMKMPRSSLISTIHETISSPLPRGNSPNNSRVYANHYPHNGGGASVEAASVVRSSSSRRQPGRVPSSYRNDFSAPPPPLAQSSAVDTSSQRALTPVNSTLAPTRSFKVGSTFRSSGSLKVDAPPPPPKVAPPVPRVPSPSIGGSSRGTRGTPRNHSSRKLGTPLSRPRMYPESRPPPAPATYERR